VLEQGEQRHAEEIRRKSEEERRNAYEQELERLETDLLLEAQDLVRQEQGRRDQEFQDALRAAEEERVQAEEALHLKEDEVRAALAQEREHAHEIRQKEEQETRRRREEEQHRREEILRRRAEEDSRRQADQGKRKSDDEDRRRREEESRRRGETDRRRREEELRKQEEARRVKEEEERKKREEEQRRKDEDAKVAAAERQRQEQAKSEREEQKRKEDEQRRQRIETQIAGAQSYFDAGDFEHALVEVAKALVNDPMNAAALDLEQRIKDAQASGLSQSLPGTEEPKKEEAPKPKPKFRVKKLKPTIKLGQKSPAQRRAGVRLIIAGSVVVIVSIIALVLVVHKPAPPPQRTFVVLPWTASSNSLEETLLGSALAQEVTERFERLSTISVTGYASSYNLSDHSDQPEYQPFQLGTFSTLRGSVTRSGDTIAVALQLLDSLGKMEWTGGAMKSIAQLSELPDEIAVKVADALAISSGDRTESFNYHRIVRNPDAYQIYLRAIEMRHRQTPESQRNALALLEQAIQLDPKLSEASAAAADILISEYDRGWTSRDTALSRARKFAESAVSSDPGVTDGYIQLGRVLALQKNYKEASENFDNALKLAPGSSHAHLENGKVLLITGRTMEASDEFLRAYKLDPCDPVVLETCGLAQAFLHAPRHAIAYYLRELYFVDDSAKTIIGPIADAVASDPDLSLTYNGQVIAACERSMELNSSDYVGMYRLARLKQLLGIWQEANSLLSRTQGVLQSILRQHPKDGRALAYQSLVLTRLGRFPEAVTSGQKAVEADPRNAEVHYLVAQMYSLQMYSGKKKQIDPQKKADGLQALKEALAIHYDLAAVTNADFFNMTELPEFRSVLQEAAE